MAIQNTFSRSIDGLTRDAPKNYQRYVDTSSFTPEQQVAFNRAASLAPAGSIASSTIQPAGGGSPMLPSGGASVQGDSSDSFNKLMLGLLNSARGLTTSDLLKKRRLLERASITASAASTPEDERMLDPSQQNALRSARAGTLSPEIDENAYAISKAEQSIDNFFTIFDRAQKINKEYAEKMSPPQESIDAMVKVISNSPEKFDKLFGSLNEKGQDSLVKALAAGNVSLTPKKDTADTSGTMVDVGGRKLLINPKTGATIKDLGASTGSTEASPYQQERAFRTVQSVNELTTKAQANPGIFGRSAAVPIPDSFRSEAFRNFRAELDTLKASITFGELTAMREASKTGGALGQVSDVENKLLSASLGALDMTQSPENFIQQLKKVGESIARWQRAVDTNSQNISGATVRMKGPQGTFDVPQDKVEEFKQNGYQTI